jgi:hypothetical protein
MNEKLVTPITQEKLKHVAKNMVACKSLGLNGVGIKCFTYFWDIFGEDY